METLVVSNFKGRLVKELFGDINSGNSPVSLPYGGIDPFYSQYSSSLDFLPATSNIAGATVTAPIMRAINRLETANNIPMVYGADINGGVYSINSAAPHLARPDSNTISKFTNNPTATLNWGGGILISKISGTNYLYIGHDSGVSWTAESGGTFPFVSATWTNMSTGISTNQPRPIVEFLGKIYVGSGSNISESTDGFTYTTNTKLSPSIPPSYIIRDISVSSDGRYLLMIASQVGSSGTLDTHFGNQAVYSPIDSVLVRWNGIDSGYTDLQFFKGIDLSAIGASNVVTVLFGKDEEGLAIFDLQGNRVGQVFDCSSSCSVTPPMPGSIFSIGKKFYFLSQQGFTSGSGANIYLYCFDSSDGSIYPVYFGTNGNNETVKGAVIFPSYHYSQYDGTDLTRDKIYFSMSLIPYSTQANNKFMTMHLRNYGSEAIQSGYYNTQIQKFGKKVSIKEVRVYTEPTTPNNSFTLSVRNNNTIISTLTYTYASGTDETQAQGALDVIKFNPDINKTQSIGFQFQNTGASSIVVHKIEADYEYVSRVPQTPTK